VHDAIHVLLGVIDHLVLVVKIKPLIALERIGVDRRSVLDMLFDFW